MIARPHQLLQVGVQTFLDRSNDAVLCFVYPAGGRILKALYDRFQRRISYLRVSVTDRCNFRCFYCMPPEGVPSRSHQDILTYEELARFVGAAAQLGISKIRLTGGEPLVRLGITNLVAMVAATPGIEDVALTTNGLLLGRFAAELKSAGLCRVNVSLDTLRADRFAEITRVGELGLVLESIKVAERVGLTPIKINTVAMRGVNDDELADIAALTLKRDWNVRFIELMPVGESVPWAQEKYMPMAEVQQLVAQLGQLEPCLSSDGSAWADGQGTAAVRGGHPWNPNGPARYFRLAGARGTIGFISPISQHFCDDCNRMRLTADGQLRSCLLWDDEVDVRAALRDGATAEELQQLIIAAVQAKPQGHRLGQRGGLPHGGRRMSEIGG